MFSTGLQVIQAYQAGVSALRLSLKDVTVDRAENLVDQIQEVAAPFKTCSRPIDADRTVRFSDCLTGKMIRLSINLNVSFSDLTSCVTLKMR